MRTKRVATWLAIGVGIAGVVACSWESGEPKAAQTAQRDTVACDPETEPTCFDDSGTMPPAYCSDDGSWSCCDPNMKPNCRGDRSRLECRGAVWICARTGEP